MTSEATVTRQDVGGGRSIFTRSDGHVFHLVWHENGSASLFHDDAAPPDKIEFHVGISDKLAAAKARILEYPDGWVIPPSRS